MAKLGFELGHPNSDKPISVMLKSIVEDESAKNLLENQLSARGISKNVIGYEERDYQAVHLNFRRIGDPSVTCEIQITDLANNHINTLGYRSHILYKVRKHSLRNDASGITDPDILLKFYTLGEELYERRTKFSKNIANGEIELCPHTKAMLSIHNGVIMHTAYTKPIEIKK